MTNTQQPSNTMKVIAVLGFTAIIAFLVWLAVTLVAVLPGAFSSLASLAEGIQQSQPGSEIVVANSNSIVNNGEGFNINWSNLNRSGVYTLYYECTDGVAIDMRYPANNITAVPCGEVVKLGSDVSEIELIARSEKKRFIDVPYSIGFILAGEKELAYQTDTTFTVVNVNIPQSQIVAETNEPEGEVAGESADTTDESTEETTDTANNTTTQEPDVITTEIYELPNSDPDGFIDLAVTYRGAGRLAVTNEFVPGSTIAENTQGAFQFEVRNLGTKTSDDWTFVADLPTGTEYESPVYDGLLPNERTTITIGFDSINHAGVRDIAVAVNADNDISSANDGFATTVTIVD